MTLDIGIHIYYKEERGEILNITSDKKRCLILIYESKTVNGTPLQTWVYSGDITIDYQFYRNETINNILNNSNS